MAKRVRRVTVASVEQQTPHLRRIVFKGSSLDDFPEGMEGGYVKLLLVDPGDPSVELPKAPKRSYTIRAFDRAIPALTLEFVIHEPAGPATGWALQASPGDDALLAGPGAVQPIDVTADHVLLASDLSGLPALAVNLARLPAEARGHAVVEIPDSADEQRLTCPPGVTLEWLVNPHPEPGNLALAERVRALPWPEGRVGAWVAGEFNNIRDLRRYLRNERGLGPDQLYISSYWKRGSTDEEHRVAKKALAGA
ncbi:MAG: siderophore-interacting protein [Myxococcota bacterium]